MTSNAGVGEKKITVGFDAENDALKQASVLDSLSSYFKPEFLNRFDTIIEFNHLEKDNLIKIVDLMLAELKETLQEQNITLSVAAEVKEKLAELGYHPAFGARPLRRAIQEQLEDRITDLLLDDADVSTVNVTLNEASEITVQN
jgi:ATP-dependent Clp protease ATP-binding subunit ClpE